MIPAVRAALPLLVVLAGLGGCAASREDAAASRDPRLAGCWRSVRMALVRIDGRQAAMDDDRCVLRIDDRTIVSTCDWPSVHWVVEYAWQPLAGGRYRATATRYPGNESQVGTSKEYDYRIEGDRLTQVTFPEEAKPKPTGDVRRFESVLQREPC